jgi:hypothetical protein
MNAIQSKPGENATVSRFQSLRWSWRCYHLLRSTGDLKPGKYDGRFLFWAAGVGYGW